MDLSELLFHTVDALEKHGVPYAVVGSAATSAYGQPRMTADIDIVVDIRPDQVRGFCAEFPLPEFYVSAEAAQEAVRRRGQFNVLHSGSGNKVDLIVAKLDAWHRGQLARRRAVPFPGDRSVYVASPEDVMIAKMIFYRDGESEKHIRDIKGILKVRGEALDRAYIEEWAARLDLTDIWHRILAGPEHPDEGR